LRVHEKVAPPRLPGKHVKVTKDHKTMAGTSYRNVHLAIRQTPPNAHARQNDNVALLPLIGIDCIDADMAQDPFSKTLLKVLLKHLRLLLVARDDGDPAREAVVGYGRLRKLVHQSDGAHRLELVSLGLLAVLPARYMNGQQRRRQALTPSMGERRIKVEKLTFRDVIKAQVWRTPPTF
jgi:hypothetical protein